MCDKRANVTGGSLERKDTLTGSQSPPTRRTELATTGPSHLTAEPVRIQPEEAGSHATEDSTQNEQREQNGLGIT